MTSGQRICVLACCAGTDRLSAHVLGLVEAWSRRGFRVVVVVAADRPDSFAVEPGTMTEVAGVLVRRNIGYDFGSWRAALHALPAIRQATLVAFANSSVYGPLDTFDRMLERVAASTADIVGLTDSFQVVHHLQSYLVFYKPGALRSPAFERFWRPVRWGDREETIRNDELPFLFEMQMAGLRIECLFPARRHPIENPTLERWRELVEAGFPFAKIQLLRDNDFDADIEGWNELLSRHGYDAGHVIRDLGNRYAASAAARAFRSPETGGTARQLVRVADATTEGAK